MVISCKNINPQNGIKINFRYQITHQQFYIIKYKFHDVIIKLLTKITVIIKRTTNVTIIARITLKIFIIAKPPDIVW